MNVVMCCRAELELSYRYSICGGLCCVLAGGWHSHTTVGVVNCDVLSTGGTLV